MIERRALMAVVVCCLGLRAASLVTAGPLDPPAGPVAATGPVQLSDALTPLPYTITEPGSYVLTSNLTGVAGAHGIIVQADDVTIDLNGFMVAGVAGSLDGVRIESETARCVIRNGFIRSWGGAGIRAPFGEFFEPQAMHTRLDNVHAALNGADGINLGTFAVVSNCVASENSFSGIRISEEGVIRDSLANDNGQIGIGGSNRSLIVNCVSNDNGTSGIVTVRGMVRGCLSAFNGGQDIEAVFPAETTLIDNHTD